jgi:hypothetical protein
MSDSELFDVRQREYDAGANNTILAIRNDVSFLLREISELDAIKSTNAQVTELAPNLLIMLRTMRDALAGHGIRA